MSDELFTAARRTSKLVGREDNLNTIRATIDRGDDTCQLVFITGKGGMGKSRLLEEILWRYGSADMREPESMSTPSGDLEWNLNDKVLAANLVDLSGAKLQARHHFIHELFKALRSQPGVSNQFAEYEQHYEYYRKRRLLEYSYKELEKAKKTAEDFFLINFQKAAEKQRILIGLDTAEQHALTTSKWLLDHGLLSETDLTHRSQQWLIEKIEKNQLKNTTILLAGRVQEGASFFDVLAQAAEKGSVALTCVEMKPLDLDETRTYFEYLAQDWEAYAEKNPEFWGIAKSFERLAKNKEQLKVLGHYTNGQPVRLSLYSDILIEGLEIPEPLTKTYAETLKLVGAIGSKEWQKAAKEIEGEFIRLLFAYPNLQTEILKALVRTPRGLLAEQIHYLLDYYAIRNARHWEPNSVRVNEIDQQLQTMGHLSIFKQRGDKRVGLQDEIYTIYKNHICDPSSADMPASIQLRADEQEARRWLYQKIINWTQEKQASKEEDYLKNQLAYEKRLMQDVSPASVIQQVKYQELEKFDERRLQLRNDIRDLELERVHYALRMNPGQHINDNYFDLSERRAIANDEQAYYVVQTELWRVLSDENAIPFMPLIESRRMKEDQEKPIQVLRRVAQQEDTIRWIRRYIMQFDYDQAIKFCDDLEDAITKMEPGPEKRSWDHTLSRCERICWREYASLMLYSDTERVKQAIHRLNEAAKALTPFTHKRRDERVVEREEGKGEAGFNDHPAKPRVIRIIALIYNSIGFGYTKIGQFKEAVKNYGQALMFMRETEFLAQQATTRNNLARALAEIGRDTRARRICMDALEIRRKMGSEVPLALSLNTLALIDNAWRRPETAWVEAIKATRYFQRMRHIPGEGLALIQLGEALRQLASLPDLPVITSDTASSVLDMAIVVLEQSRNIFEELVKDDLRLIEARLVLGCAYRDQYSLPNEEMEKDKREAALDKARDTLETAAYLARQIGNTRLIVDALILQATVHARKLNYLQAETTLSQAEALLPDSYKLQIEKMLPVLNDQDTKVFSQLSIIDHLRGSMALDQFRATVNSLESELKKNPANAPHNKVDQKDKAHGLLDAAAQAYVRALAYAQLFSPRSKNLSDIYNNLYDVLKLFNKVELEDFTTYERKAQSDYGTGLIQAENMGNLKTFLDESFGMISQGESA